MEYINISNLFTFKNDIEKNINKKKLLRYIQNVKQLTEINKNHLNNKLYSLTFTIPEAIIILNKHPSYNKIIYLQNEDSKKINPDEITSLISKYENIYFEFKDNFKKVIRDNMNMFPIKFLCNIFDIYSANFLAEHKDFTFDILTYKSRDGLLEWRYNYLSIHPKLDLNIVIHTIKNHEEFKEYQDWNFAELNRNSKMTFDFAVKFMEYKKLVPDFMKNFNALLSQPWMNSSFIEKYITNKYEKIYYLQIYNEISTEKKSRERNKLFYKDLIEVTSQTGYFFKNVLSQEERDELGISDELLEMSKEYPIQLNHKKLIDSIQYV